MGRRTSRLGRASANVGLAMNRPATLFFLSLATAACGATTGLHEPDAAVVAPVDVPVDIPVVRAHQPFEGCALGDSCSGDTACVQAIFPSAAAPARLCSVACTTGTTCPQRGPHSSLGVGCALQRTTTETVGQCYELCQTSANCGPGTQCVQRADLAVRFCLPIALGR